MRSSNEERMEIGKQRRYQLNWQVKEIPYVHKLTLGLTIPHMSLDETIQLVWKISFRMRYSELLNSKVLVDTSRVLD